MPKTIMFLFICLFMSVFVDESRSQAHDTDVLTWKNIEEFIDTLPAMRQSQAEVNAARAGIDLAGQYPNPELGVSAGREESNGTSESSLIWGLEVGIPIESPGAIIMESRAAEEDFEAVRYAGKDARIEIRRLLKTVFISIAFETEVRRALADHRLQLSRLVKFARRRVEQGEARPMEQQRLEIELYRTEAEFKAADKKLKALKKSLDMRLGGNLPDDFTAEFNWKALPEIPTLEDSLTAAERRHPAISAEKHRLAASVARTKAERHRLFPDMTLGGFYNRETEARNYGGMLNIELPLWNWNGGGIAKAAAEEKAARHRNEAFDGERKSAICEAHAATAEAIERARIYAGKILPGAQANARDMQSMYSAGEINLMDAMDANRSLIEIETETLTAICQFWSAYFELMALTGDDNV